MSLATIHTMSRRRPRSDRLDDLADFAAKQLLSPTNQHRVVHELGADYLMTKIAAIISQETGHPIDYRFIDRNRPEIQSGFLQRFGSLERWLEDTQTVDALKDGRVRFQDTRSLLPTTMEQFIRTSFKPQYYRETVQRPHGAEQFVDWIARDDLGTS